jgi:hypothetical protein
VGIACPDVEAVDAGLDISKGRSRDVLEAPMKYLLLIYHNPGARQVWEAFSEAQRAEDMAAYAALNDELAASGELIAAESLADPQHARRVAVRDGRLVASDGPFAEVKEELAGFYLVDCESMDRAVAIAGRIPEAAAAEIEVRPIMTYTGQEM